MKMDVYSYSTEDLAALHTTKVLSVDFVDRVAVPWGVHALMVKSLRLATTLVKNMAGGSIGPKPETKWPAGRHWITIHPHGREEGVPLLIQDNGDGTGHVISGAKGKLNMLKLNRLSSPEDAKAKAEQRKKENAESRKGEKAARQEKLAAIKNEHGEGAVQDIRAKEKQEKEELREAKRDAMSSAVQKIKELTGWKPDAVSLKAESKIKELNEQADKTEDADEAARLRLKAQRVQNNLDEAMRRQMSSVISQAKETVKGFKRDMVKDKDLQAEVLGRLQAEAAQNGQDIDEVSTGAETVIKKGKSDNGKGFKTDYEGKAKERGLTDDDLKEQKADLDEARLDQIEAEEGLDARWNTEALIKKVRDKNAAIREVYQRKEFDAKVTELDKKVELLKTVGEYEKAMKALNAADTAREKRKIEVQRDRDLDADFRSTSIYGDGVALPSYSFTPGDFAKAMMSESESVEAERMARINGDFLASVKKETGAGKWIANGVYQGLNSVGLEILKGEAIPRDVVDVLGVGPAAKLMAYAVARLHSDDLAYVQAGLENFHQATNEAMVTEAHERGSELLGRAESIKAELAEDAGDLLHQHQLNETRLEYIDEAHRILGQTLGHLEAQAALASELKTGGAGPIDISMGAMSNGDLITKLAAIGLGPEDYNVVFAGKQRIARLSDAAKSKLLESINPDEVHAAEAIQDIKNGGDDEPGWLPHGIVSRPFDSFSDAGAEPAEGSLDEQAIGNDDATKEALHRTLGELPAGRLAYADPSEFTPQDQTDLRRYWEESVYKGSGAEASHGSNFYIGGGAGTTKSKEWAKFVEKSGGRAEAVSRIKEHLATAGEEDMFGGKSPHPLAQVDDSSLDRYRQSGDLDELKSHVRGVEGADDLVDHVRTLKENADKGLSFNSGRQDWEDNPAKAKAAHEAASSELPGKLKAAHDEALRNHYHDEMSGLKPSDYATTDEDERNEGTAWGEYVRMHGDDPARAMESVQDLLRGRLNTSFAANYAKVGKIKLQTGESEIRNRRDHVLGMLSREDRDNFKNKANAALAEAGATVANRSGGKFAEGAWRDKAYELLSNKDKGQMSMFGDEDLKQDDGTRIPTLGPKVESALKEILPEASANQRRGEKYQVFPGFSMSDKYAVQQRAVKAFEKAGKMNLTFGTGQGKSVTSIGSFTHLYGKGKAKRALFAVPSVVQGQFGGEMAKYTKPGMFKWKADPELDQAGRIAALKDPDCHMYVGTHQSLRDDLVYLMAEHQGKSADEVKAGFNAAKPEERTKMLHSALDHHGVKFDMLTTDEAHYATNRAGKEDSTLSNVLDALSSKTPYVMNQSATPVKNDASEAWDILRRVAPDKFPNRDEFLARYGVDTEYSAQALRRIIGRYNYAAPTVTGVTRNSTKEEIKLTPKQQAAYDKVGEMFRRASTAGRSGRVDIEAMKFLSPGSFEGRTEDEHQGIAARLQPSAGIIKEEALNRTVNAFPAADNAKMHKLHELVESKRYGDDDAPKGAMKGQRAPGVVFAHNLDTVDQIRSELEKKGLRVGVIHGGVTGADKEKIKNDFNPMGTGQRQYDVMVLSDAGATGLNLQNAKYLVNYDLPQTAWVKTQREGRIDRHGQAHRSVDYHDLVTDTPHEAAKWKRIERKAALGQVFQEDDGLGKDDTGVLSYIRAVKHDRAMRGAAA